jgi:predicted ATPase
MALLRKGHAPTSADCQAALALRRGPFLDGFGKIASPQFEEWLVVMAEQVDYLAGQALAHLVRDCTARGDFAQAAVWARQQLALEPWNEEVHQQLIWQLAMSGQPAAALHHYDLCCQMLAKELGVTPQPATQALVARIRSGELGADALTQHRRAAQAPSLFDADDNENSAVASPLAPRPSPLPSDPHLPPRPRVFFGRTAELATVAARLADPACRLLTILGPGGMGKTLLAVEAAHTQAAHFADGVWFVDLAPVATPDLVSSAILRALGLPPVAPSTAAERLMEHLRARQALLLLDNFEHLLDGADLLPRLLDAAPGLKLLITTRARLHLKEEWLLPLTGLTTPPVGALGQDDQSDALTDFPSMQLFLRRLHQLDANFQPTPADLEQGAEICRLLEGMPLAIELAAGWARSLALAEIAQAVRSRLDLFTTPLRDLPSRHRSMHAVFDHSWRLLDDRERSLLRQLAVFRGGCALDAAMVVAGATLADLERLVDKSWLRVQERRYGLHELMRQYCAGKLAEEHEAATGESAGAVHRRHCAYYAGAAGAEERLLNWKTDSMAFLRADFGNLEAAWRWAVDHGDLAATRQMMNGLFFVAEMTGWFDALLPFFEDAAVTLRTRWQQAGDDTVLRQETAHLLTNLLFIQQSLFMHVGWLTRVQDVLDEMQAILAVIEHDALWQEHDFWRRWAATIYALNLGNYAGAHASARELLSFVQTVDQVFWPWRADIGNRFWEMHLHAMLGATARLLGWYDAAQADSEAALQVSERMGEQRFKANTLRDLAVLSQIHGDYEQALAVAQQGLALSQRLGDHNSAAYGELALGWIEIDAGHLTLAEERLKRSLAAALTSGEFRLHVSSLAALARIDRLQGNLAAAQCRLEEAISRCAQPGITRTNQLAVVLLELGHTAHAARDWPQARRFYTEALDAAGCTAAQTQAARAGLAEAAWAEHDKMQARRLLTDVIDDPATEATTRRSAQQMLVRWELVDELDELVGSNAWSALPKPVFEF